MVVRTKEENDRKSMERARIAKQKKKEYEKKDEENLHRKIERNKEI